MTDEKLKQFFKLAEELYKEEFQKRAFFDPPVYVDVEDENNLIIISCLSDSSSIIKEHLKNVLTEVRVGTEAYKKGKR